MSSSFDETEYLDIRFANLEATAESLVKKVFEGCEFRDCDFSEAKFLSCKFVECKFIQCNLSVARVDGSGFNDVCFEGCKAIGIDWTRANWPRVAMSVALMFRKCNVSDSSFMNLKLQKMVLEECKASDVDFRGGDFSDSNFNHTDFTSAQFGRTRLIRVDFTEAIGFEIDVTANDLRKAKFSRLEALRLLNSLQIELVD